MATAKVARGLLSYFNFHQAEYDPILFVCDDHEVAVKARLRADSMVSMYPFNTGTHMGS